jgi:asparagine synthase (glutamine-hydrolysing)
MCGICGYVGLHRPELLEPMCLSLAHRGPDNSGIWYDRENGVGLGHRRLSIIDLSLAGHQPMANSERTIVLSYNGEIYNFPELRKSLESKGYRFRGSSDTEVLLYLYEEHGVDSLNMLNGIFSFAIWDSRKKELMLARDHAGVKPLYYWQDGTRLYFASEIKALLRIPGIPRQLNESAIHQYLTFLWVGGKDTMLKSIKKIEPGHYLIWKNGRVVHKQWFTLDYTPDRTIPESEWIELIRETFLHTTRRQMVADAPLGAFLSGGLDSSSIVAFMRKSFPDRDINCYTISYNEEDVAKEGFEGDLSYAKKVAEFHNINLKEVVFGDDSQKLLPKIIYHLDEPDADPAALLTFLIADMANKDGIKVLLSGAGGDEVFFGYRSHQAYKHYQNLGIFPRALTGVTLSAFSYAARCIMGQESAFVRRMGKFTRGFKEQGLRRHLSLVDWINADTRSRIISEDFSAALPNNGFHPAYMDKYFTSFIGTGEINRHSHVLMNTYLAAHNFMYTDKATMAASIEGRVPFVDVELLKLTASIPEEIKFSGMHVKPLLGKSMEPFLPREIIERSKTGFGIPLRKWITNGLDELVMESLSSQRVRERGIFKPEAIQRIILENRLRKVDHTYLIYALLSLELWQQTFIDKPGIEVSV